MLEILQDDRQQMCVERREPSTSESGGSGRRPPGHSTPQKRPRRRHADSLQEAKHNYDALVHSSMDAVVVIAEDDTVLSWNPAAQDLFGVPRRDAVGRSVREFVDPPGGWEDEGRYRRAHRGRRADGEEIDVLVVAARGIREGAPTRLLTIRDLAPQRLLEEKTLEAQKLGAVAQLATGAVHDFNNLLMAISGAVSVASRGLPTASPVGDRLDDIRDAVRTGASIARQLLNLVRKGGEERDTVLLDDAVRSSRAILEALVGDDVDLVVDLDAPAAVVQTCPAQVEQVLMNLVVNARDAMPGGGQIAICTRDVGEGDDRAVLLTVTDTGSGIPATRLEQVFEPYFTTKGTRGGTGLGLYVVRDIVTRSGGEVRVHSTQGEGTTVSILMPVVADVWNGFGDRMPTHVYRRALFDPVGTILVADTHDMALEAVRRLLDSEGHRVLVATDMEAVERLLRENRDSVSLLLCDMSVASKGTSPAEVVSRLAPDVPVLYMSARGLPTGDECMDDAHVIAKPFTHEELRRRITRLLTDRRAHRPRPSTL